MGIIIINDVLSVQRKASGGSSSNGGGGAMAHHPDASSSSFTPMEVEEGIATLAPPNPKAFHLTDTPFTSLPLTKESQRALSEVLKFVHMTRVQEVGNEVIAMDDDDDDDAGDLIMLMGVDGSGHTAQGDGRTGYDRSCQDRDRQDDGLLDPIDRIPSP